LFYYIVFCAYKYKGCKKYLWIFGISFGELALGLLEAYAWPNSVNNWLCVIFNTLTFFSLLQKIRATFKTRNHNLLPWQMCIISILSSIFWGVYLVLKEQLYLLIPNAIGFALSLFGLIAYLFFRVRSVKIIQTSSTLSNLESPDSSRTMNNKVVAPSTEEKSKGCISPTRLSFEVK
jgi:hypothetical protein